MIMKPRIQFTHIRHELSSKLDNIIGKSLTADILVSFSNFHHHVTLFSFNNKILINKWTDIIKHFSGGLPIINRPTESFLASPSVSGILRTSEDSFEPQDKAFVSACDSDKTMKVESASVTLTGFRFSDIKATFSIDYTSKICNFCKGLIFMIYDNFSHFVSNILVTVFRVICYGYNYIVINENINSVQPERLNKKTNQYRYFPSFISIRCDSLNSDRKTERRIRRGFPA